MTTAEVIMELEYNHVVCPNAVLDVVNDYMWLPKPWDGKRTEIFVINEWS